MERRRYSDGWVQVNSSCCCGTTRTGTSSLPVVSIPGGSNGSAVPEPPSPAVYSGVCRLARFCSSSSKASSCCECRNAESMAMRCPPALFVFVHIPAGPTRETRPWTDVARFLSLADESNSSFNWKPVSAAARSQVPATDQFRGGGPLVSAQPVEHRRG